jgi:alpha-aminoadipate carrier protein LysW
MAKTASCPTCGADVEIPDGTEIGEIMECADCGAELEVRKLEPPALSEAPEEQEDWGE